MSTIVPIADIDVHVEGDGAETIVMVHGWPDTYRLWDAQIEFLKSRYRCIRFTLPGFDAAKTRQAFSVDRITEFLERVVKQLCPDRKVILMLHDWGCIFGYEFYMRHQELVSRIVGVDIGDASSLGRTLSPRDKFVILAYQLWLAFAWIIGGRVGDRMTVQMARWTGRPSDERFISSCMTYPYYLAWFGGQQAYRRQLRPFTPSCPMLYVYARRKPVMFHAKAWIDDLLKRKGNQVVEFDTGHWVMLEQPARFHQAVSSWLATTRA